MDKFVKILAKDEPYITPDCPNCNNALKIKQKIFSVLATTMKQFAPTARGKSHFPA